MKNKYSAAVLLSGVIAGALAFWGDFFPPPGERALGVAVLLPIFGVFFIISYSLFLVSFFRNRGLNPGMPQPKTDKVLALLGVIVTALIVVFFW